MEITIMALQDLIYEESGTVGSVRVLPDARIEVSFQGSGNLLGVDVTTLLTTVGTRQPDGTVVFEGWGVATTRDGDSVTVKAWGVRRPTGGGLKSSSRGFDIWQTASVKFARLNNTTYVWETEADEAGNYHLKLWEWK
jgi:hypothetical protein